MGFAENEAQSQGKRGRSKHTSQHGRSKGLLSAALNP